MAVEEARSGPGGLGFRSRPTQVNGASTRPAMAPTQAKSGLFVGINKGHVVTKRELPLRPSNRKGV
ncbi:unnamed protein product [Miscanthus lutarioriparius]|uniref:60S ribosomal protein L36 n=1 Tax=Miscanthus lutarioriparius TaxID=422564 RepID=A0A811MEL6_9POAL|nr:unnamed protein product [Miscanthus lutarioriparius]